MVGNFVAAINAGDQDAFFAPLTSDSTMSDNGTERDLKEWVDREIFSSTGRMEVESEVQRGPLINRQLHEVDPGLDARRLEVRHRG